MSLPHIYIISGGVGSSGEQLVHTVLAQFPEVKIPVVVFSHIRTAKQIDKVIHEAVKTNGIVLHTLVDDELREYAVKLIQEEGVFAIDAMGDLMVKIEEIVGHKPVGQPGLYRKKKQDYFDRISAIEYTLAHDDGKKTKELDQADIVLLGISRTGKTPLSMYLSVMGWKVANVPIVLGVSFPDEVFKIDCRRVIGLDINPKQLIIHRRKRQKRLGMADSAAYIDEREILKEVRHANSLYERGKFSTINITGKPIESSSAEIIEIITEKFNSDSWKT